MQKTPSTDVDHLNSFLRGELSAVETYRMAMERLDTDPIITGPLSTCQKSHMDRVSQLSSEITSLGGQPATDSGPWGSFAKLVQGGASVFGKSAALAALEEGEDHGLNDYRRDASELSPSVKQFVEQRLLPEQRRTHDTLSELKKRV